MEIPTDPPQISRGDVERARERTFPLTPLEISSQFRIIVLLSFRYLLLLVIVFLGQRCVLVACPSVSSCPRRRGRQWSRRMLPFGMLFLSFSRTKFGLQLVRGAHSVLAWRSQCLSKKETDLHQYKDDWSWWAQYYSIGFVLLDSIFRALVYLLYVCPFSICLPVCSCGCLDRM